MGHEPDPWTHFGWPKWLNNYGLTNLNIPLSGIQSAGRLGFPAHASHYEQSAVGNMPPVLGASKHIQLNSAFDVPINSKNVPTPAVLNERKFLIFDQSANRTTLVFSSLCPPVWKANPANPKQVPPGSGLFQGDIPANTDQINRSDKIDISQMNESDEIHEDTEDIDALLYSDSEDEEQNSTGHSPATISGLDEEVASSGGPTKRRRLEDEETEGPLLDTASSADAHVWPHAINRKMDDGDGSSCVRDSPKWRGDDDEERDSTRTSGSNKRRRRDRISKTVDALRGIIPGCKGKDAVVVLDEAIRYLKSLGLKARASGLPL